MESANLYRRKYRIFLSVFLILPALWIGMYESFPNNFYISHVYTTFLAVTINAIIACRANYWKGRFEEATSKGLQLW